MKFVAWLKFCLDCVMCAVKYMWLVMRVPLSMPAAGIILFCFIITIPIWFVAACINDGNADELIRDFKNWYLGPIGDYWEWCLKTFRARSWTSPAQELLVNFPRDL